MSAQFLFIVGMPRSGTKLIRDILNNHSQVAIFEHESKVLPYFYLNRKRYDNFQHPDGFAKFYSDFTATEFYKRISVKGFTLGKDEWLSKVNNWDYGNIIETFYRLYAEKNNAVIYGDKSPGYQTHVKLLKSIFPNAKFLHIIRDVRDAALSSRNVWNKNIYRYAHRWNSSIEKYFLQVNSLNKEDHIEIKYEDLLLSGDEVIKSVCKFLSVDFKPGMMNLEKQTELYGQAKDNTGILVDNFNKWRNSYTESEIEKLESIAVNQLKKLNYPCDYNGKARKLSGVELSFLKLKDGLNLFKFYSGESESDKFSLFSSMIKSYKMKNRKS